MTAWAVIEGERVASLGTVLADPLPAGMAATALTAPQWDAIRAGAVLDVASGTVGAPPDPGPDYDDELLLAVLA